MIAPLAIPTNTNGIRIENTMNFLMVDCSITIYQNKTNQRQTTRSHNSLYDGAALQLANASGAFYNLIISTEPEFHCSDGGCFPCFLRFAVDSVPCFLDYLNYINNVLFLRHLDVWMHQ